MIYIFLFFLSFLLTYAIREFAIKKSIMDIPNERSSHTIPTPRGGGLAIIITFYIGLFFVKEDISRELFLALFAALPIVIIGLIDDIISLSSKLRFTVQALSAILALYLLGGVDSIDFVLFKLTGWWLNLVALFFMIWLTNLYNFLDGIDGYAGTQTLTLGLGIFFIFSSDLGLVLVVASLGFLLLNWHKASIFMGDVGSATLGFIFGVLSFSNVGQGGEIYFWLVALSLFWFDATVTLLRRYKNGEKITEAHRKHAYQRLVQSGWSHEKVTIGLLLFNTFFLLLLYWFENWGGVFLVSLVFLFAIMRFIEHKKGFE